MKSNNESNKSKFKHIVVTNLCIEIQHGNNNNDTISKTRCNNSLYSYTN